MHLIVRPPAMSKIVGQTVLFSLGMATDLGEGKLWIPSCYTLLKKTDLVSHLARAEELVNTYYK